MKRPIALLIVATGMMACSSSDEAPPDADGPRAGLAQGLTITEVAAFQVVKVPIAKDGAKADRGRLAIVAGREALLRVYVKPDATFRIRPITGTLRIVASTPTSDIRFAPISVTTTISGASVESKLDSTINFEVPATYLAEGARFSIALTDPGTPPGEDPKTSSARYPRDGTLSPLGVASSGDQVRIMVVPVQYDVDGSGKTPDTGPVALQKLADAVRAIYPTPKVEMSVHEPFSWKKSGGLGSLLPAIQALRGADRPPDDLYYYGLVLQLGAFAGPVLGLSPVGMPASVGVVGFDTGATLAHEVGHAHGRRHAPCGGAAGPDPEYPYPNGSIGVWGYDQTISRLVDPGTAKDFMGYCQPRWISDFHYVRLFDRVAGDNRVSALSLPDRRRYRMVIVGEDGSLSLGETTSFVRAPAGEPHELVQLSSYESVIARQTVQYFPYSHLPGGIVLVPEEEATPTSAGMRISGPTVNGLVGAVLP